jgi:hypothetical protein
VGETANRRVAFVLIVVVVLVSTAGVAWKLEPPPDISHKSYRSYKSYSWQGLSPLS